jgi:hypothetical protein
MKFHDIFFANLTASKSTGAGQEFLKLYCKDKILTVGNSLFTISNHLGRVGRKSKYEKQGLFSVTKILENFALSVLLPDKNKLCSSASENLRNMAVIEAAYLSGRTGMPEEPNRILKMAQLEHTDIRPEHK